MLRDLLVHVDGSEAGRRRTQFAVALAESTGARLSGLHVTPPPEVPPRYKPSLVERVQDDLAERLAADARCAASVFRGEAQQRLGTALWTETAGDVVELICRHARYADLVILGQYEWQGTPETHPLPVVHSVILRSGRPVLALPAAARASNFERVALAWDGSREAVRAAHDALPLLRRSRSVQIVTMITGSSREDSIADAQRLADHLVKHGILVEEQVLRTGSPSEHAALRQQIAEGGYDLVVMGGYSHPIWMEFLFGGATEAILLSSAIPVFASH